MIKKFIFCYIVLSISVIISQLLGANTLENFLKPMLMVSLFTGYFLFKNRASKQNDYLYLAAIVFSFLGDAFLMPLFNQFLAGLTSFLMAHIFYIILYLKDRAMPIKLNPTQITILSLGLLIFLSLPSLILWKLIPQNPDYFLIIAILLYSTALFGLILTAIIRKQTPRLSYHYILAGSGLFLLSDSFLSINKFVFNLPYSPIWVISTYTSAQALIFYGFLKKNS
ncbi:MULTISPECIES: lysoplasmalogenase [unclassified Lentimicrobium]|uniref:lysoplasmalogenase n=1 Tax=unclassified Lentimicrobium TaxID=2677434 RepID=UPI001551C186|nr:MULTISPECIES: lysoplasmalogenase [unclassified Lentimicrobium]NPD47719.1 lysoplasmalogenase [Lentimicrobium sp. S6]NPD83866.1 lysoplasmalogenase [Lentimicrobium sp. L6]